MCATNCKGMVTVNADGTYTKNDTYYHAQFSKFIQPGAKRIDSNEPKIPDELPGGGDELETVAFRNPDGTIVLVANEPEVRMRSEACSS